MKVLHLADIHYRSLSRHDEYRESFEDLFKKAKKLNPDIIVIAGDLVHEKNKKITPEMIDEIVWFLTELGKISQVYIILGNHDLNLSNRSRQDVISPIVSAMRNDRVKLFKESGNYILDEWNVNLCIFSCFDEEEWEKVKPDSNFINIALYHGTVTGAVTDQDYPLGAEVPLSFFKEYDFAFLGDIHKKQFLNKNKTIAYPGSSIQQNFGEIIEKGFLFWDIRDVNDFDVKFHKIKNNCPFVTVEWQGDVKNTVDAVSKYPNTSRFRIQSDEDLSHVDKSHLESELMARGAREVIPDPRRFVSDNKEKILLKRKNLRDPKVVLDLTKDFFGEEGFKDDEWKIAEDIICEHMNKLSPDDIARNSEWSAKRLEFDNTFCYGRGNVIDFEKCTGITGIFAKNRSGKSSIIGSLMYTLHNTTDKGPIQNQNIVNNRAKSCRGKFIFSSGGKEYYIERKTTNKISKKTGKISSSTSLEFCEVGGTPRTDIKRQDTEKEIRAIVGLPEDFLLTAIAASDEVRAFIKKKSTARKDIFSRFLDMGVLEELCENLKVESKDIQREFKDMSKRDWNRSNKELMSEKKEKEGLTKSLGKTLKEVRSNIETAKRKLEELNKKSEDVVTPHDVSEQEDVVEEVKEEISSLKETLLSNKKDLEKYREELKRIEKIKKKFSLEENKQKLKSIRSMEKFLSELQSNLKYEKSELDRKEKSVKKLKIVPCGDEYPTCRFIKDSHEDKKSLSKQKNKVEKLLGEVEKQEKDLGGLNADEIESKIEKFEKLINKGMKLETSIANKETNLSNKKNRIQKLEHKLKEEESYLEDLRSRVVDSDTSKEISLTSKELRELKRKDVELDEERMEVATQIGHIDSELERYKKEKERYEEVREKWSIYEKLILAFSRKGIPALIIKSRLPEINDEISRILSGIADFKVVLEIDENSNSNDLDIFIEEDGYRTPIELNSGMEGVVSSIALRVAMINISTLPRPDILVIDEAFDKLDEGTIPACAKMYAYLKKWFKNVIIISHNEKVKTMVDNLIEIEKVGKKSFVNHV